MRKSLMAQIGIDFGGIDAELFRAAIAESDSVRGVASEAEIDSVIAILLAQTDEQIRLILKSYLIDEPIRAAWSLNDVTKKVEIGYQAEG